MPLPARTRLGPHEVLSLIGAGGSGVYKARDTRLDCSVARCVGGRLHSRLNAWTDRSIKAPPQFARRERRRHWVCHLPQREQVVEHFSGFDSRPLFRQ